MSSRSLVSAEICWNKAQVSFTAARSCFFFLVLATAGTEQAVLAQDALDGHVAQRQLPFALQAPGAEGGQLPTPFDHPLGQLPDDLVRRGVRGARESSCKPFNPCPAYRRSHLRTVATVVWKARAAGLIPC